MNRTNRILPVYAGDVSGACSALFELGGMVVIHDPSGCNSTYNTHDETRWYDHDSLIFISALMEREAILGDDDKLVRDVVDAARELRPRFIALCNSPIPFIMGTDFAALCRIIERETQIPCLYVRTNGMHDYVVGAGNAFTALAERFVIDDQHGEGPGDSRPSRSPSHHNSRLNILGVTPLDFRGKEDVRRLRAFAEKEGFSVISCWAMGSMLDELARAASADVNLVVSASGFGVAQFLWECHGTPFVVGTPLVGFEHVLGQALHEAARGGRPSFPCRDLRPSSLDGSACIVGEPVCAGSRAVALSLATGVAYHVVSPVEASDELLAPSDIRADGEEEVETALASARHVIADPLYRVVCPRTASIEPLPHLAFSGRSALV